MRLRTRALLILVLPAAALAAGVATLSARGLLEGQERLEKALFAQRVSLVASAFAAEEARLRSSARDWASWDDVDRYVATCDEDFVRKNLTGGVLDNLAIDAIVILDGRQQPVGSAVRGLIGAPAPAPASELARRFARAFPRAGVESNGIWSGAVAFEGEPALAAAVSIRSSDGRSVPRGTLLMVRRLDEGFLAPLAARADAEVAFAGPAADGIPLPAGSDPQVLVEGVDRMAGLFSLAGFDRRPAFEVRAVAARPLRAAAMRTVWNLVLSLLAVVLLAVGTTAVLLDRAILRPVKRLNDEVSRIGRQQDFSGRVTTRGRDELAELGTAINDTLGSLEGARRALDEARLGLERRVDERTADLARALAEAEASNRARVAFLANVSHELRTPMNAIIGLTAFTLDSDLTDDQRDNLAAAYAAALGLLGLLNDILDFSKIEAEALQLDPQPFALRELAESLGTTFGPEARRKGIELRVTVDAGLPARVVGDRGRLRQVLTNLVGNAMKFTLQGTVELRLKAGTPAGRIGFAVADTGIGIAPEAQQRIFRPFEQADGSTSRRYGGTGLGLAIVSQLVRQMGGEAALESEPGRGSTFSFEIDLPAADGASETAPAARTASAGARQGLRVLLVDDNPVNLRLAARLLEREGHHPATAADGQQALAALAAEPYDVVLMDVQMPVMDGLEATQELRRREAGSGRRVPVIALTAHAFPEDRTRCLAAGMDGYLAKPVAREQLLAALDEALATPA
jgi:signal transduction histidine kinase/ActR/RegA family two-component response regulator